jgi:hypothetical protein
MQLTEVLRGGRQCDEDGTEIIMSRQACHEAADQLVRLRSALAELTALVREECGALLDEDRGGSASLSMEIDDLLGPNG